MMKPSLRPLAILAVVTAIIAALSLSACSVFNPFDPEAANRQYVCVPWHGTPDTVTTGHAVVTAHPDSVCTKH
jgi:hypothetical protein